MTKDNILDRYSSSRPEIQEYMKIFVEVLKKKYGTIPKEFIISLDLLAFNFEVLFKGMTDMKENGMSETDKYRGEKKGVGLQAFFNAQNYITKILASFGFSPASAAKIREAKEEKDISKILESLSE